jgi:hypothetical protein
VSRAFFVKCDEENNPPELRQGLPTIQCDVGLNPQIPDEFLVVSIGVFDGGSTIEENLANR